MENREKLFSRIKSHILKAYKHSPSRNTLSLSELSKRIFDEDNNTATTALKSLFCFLYKHREEFKDLPSFRFHLFFRNIDGLWACSAPECSRSGSKNGKKNPTGKLFMNDPPLTCDNQHRIFESLYCEQCGTIFFGGIRWETDSGGLEILQISDNIEKIPDEHITPFIEKRSYEEYVLFWPFSEINDEIENKPWSQPLIEVNTKTGAKKLKKKCFLEKSHFK